MDTTARWHMRQFTAPLRRRALVLGATAALVLGACSFGDDSQWAGSWAAAPQDWNEPIPLPGRAQPVPLDLQDQTVRQLVRPAIGGDALRVRLSNVTGTAPVTVSASSIGRSAGGGNLVAGTVSGLSFNGATSVTIAPGAEVWSDTVPSAVSAGADLAVSLYFAQRTAYGTVHRSTFRTGWVITGNAVGTLVPSGAAAMSRTHLVSGVNVLSDAAPRVVVAFGDSITDGTNSTLDALKRYPDQLAARVPANVAVLNAGIAGNRVLNDKLGPKGTGRFTRDVLQQTGVTHTLILLGINDIGFGLFSGPPLNLIPANEVVTAEQVIAGLQQMLDQASAKGVKVLLGTLLPFKGAGYYHETTEAKRQTINGWIRGQAGRVHAIVDFDTAMRSPTDALALNPAYDSGDHLHPNDAGYGAMAAAVPLDKLN